MKFKVTQTRNSVSPEINNILKALGINGQRQLLISAANEFVRQTKSNFGGGSSKYKEKEWPKLSPSYAKKVGRTKATLKESGALMNSIKTTAPRGNWIEIYTKNPYSAAQMLGYKPRNLPKRNYFPVQIYNTSYTRLLFNSEKDMIFEIGKKLTYLSNGTLPKLSSTIQRSPPSYGNIFKRASS